MRHIHTLAVIVSAGLASACGSDGGGPDKCADGTRWDESISKCIPDGTVTCGAGTKLNEATGECETVNPTCPPPNIEVNGECVNAPPAADVNESDDPNNPAVFALPAEGDSISLGGCINPENGESDFDDFYFASNGNQMLKITAKGFGGLDAAFTIEEAQGLLPNYIRYGLDLSNTNAERTLYLPPSQQGVYAISVADTRALFFGEPAGNPDACYYVTVEPVAMPTPTALPLGDTDIKIDNTAKVFSYSTQNGDVLDLILQAPGDAMMGDFVQVGRGEFRGTVGFDSGNPFQSRSPGSTAAQRMFGLEGDALYVVDPVYYFGMGPADATLTLARPMADAPAAGADSTIPVVGTEFRFIAVPALEGDIVEFDFTSDDTIELYAIEPGGQFLVPGGDFGTDGTGLTETMFAAQEGYYYLALRYSGATPPANLTLSGEITNTATTALTTGANTLASYHTFDQANLDWVTLDSADSFTATTYIYQNGFFGLSMNEVDTLAGPLADQGAILTDRDDKVVVNVEAPGAAALDIGTRTFSDLGTIVNGSPINQTGNTLAAGETQYFLLNAALGTPIDFEVSENYTLTQLGRYEEELASGTTVNIDATATEWIAFSITGPAAGGTYDLEIDAGVPLWTDICANGTDITPTSSTDEALTAAETLPFTFTMFGDAYTGFIASTNGWLTLDTAYAGDAKFSPQAIPSTDAPNSVVSPLWMDWDQVQICVLYTANTATIQWTGIEYNSTTQLQTQAVISDTGAVSFVYGPGNQTDGTSATIGVENAAGDMATTHTTALTPNTQVDLIP